jgi:hypothetical protein
VCVELGADAALAAAAACAAAPFHAQARKDLQATIKRVKESEARIDSAIAPSVDKAYW